MSDTELIRFGYDYLGLVIESKSSRSTILQKILNAAEAIRDR